MSRPGWSLVVLMASLAMATGACTRALWEGHQTRDRAIPLGRTTLQVDRMVEDLDRNGLAFRLAPRPEDPLPPRLAEDYSKGYAWVRIEEPFRFGFLGRALALGHTPLQAESIEIVVKRVEAKSGRLRHDPVLLRIHGRLASLGLERAEPPTESGPDLLDAMEDVHVRVSLGLATNAIMRLVPAEWGGCHEMDIHAWRAVRREGRNLVDPMEPIRSAMRQRSIEPLAGCEVVIGRHRHGESGESLHVRAPLDVLLCMTGMEVDPDGEDPVWTWQGYWKGRTDESPDTSRVRPMRAQATLSAIVEEYEIRNDSTLATVLLTPFALAGDIAVGGLIAWAEGEAERIELER